MSLDEAALFNPAALAPAPAVMFATFAAPEIMLRLVALIAPAASEKPAIEPEFAVTAPAKLPALA
jgi:hypothetical protein